MVKNIDQRNTVKYHRPLPNSPATLFVSLCNRTEQLVFKELYMHTLVPGTTEFQEHLNTICQQIRIGEYHIVSQKESANGIQSC